MNFITIKILFLIIVRKKQIIIVISFSLFHYLINREDTYFSEHTRNVFLYLMLL